MNKTYVINSILDHIESFGQLRGYKSKKHINEINWINEYFSSTELYYKDKLVEKIWVLLNDDYVHHCPACGVIPQFRNFNIGYSNHCKDCGRQVGANTSAKNKQTKSPKIIVFKKCKECEKEFSYESRKLNNTINKDFCSKSCAQKYHHKNRSIEDKKKRLEKIKSTNKQKYGDEWVVNSRYSKDKTKEKLGVAYAFQRKDILEKCIKTLEQRTGFKYPFNNPDTIEKMKKTKIEKYGDLLSPMYKYKEYIMPSGKKYKIQGNEHLALDELLKTYKEEDIVITRRLIEKYTGSIKYKDKNDNEHVYYPDIYLIPDNAIIEVKSQFTYDLHKEINEFKKQACIKRGFNFEFRFYN